MSNVSAPDFGSLLAPIISRVPAEAVPRFLALLERGAAQRYRDWAAVLPVHADVLLQCAAAEDEIADRIDAAFTIDLALLEELHVPLPAALGLYNEVFAGYDVWSQLRIQAAAERQGAGAWRSIAARLGDGAREDVLDALRRCSSLEEASADRLDALIRAAAPAG